jgi:exopolysaccharide biosynthesis polyprenyl glycosylphosphotransferase
MYDDLEGAVDQRTLDILERRRKTAVIKRRGWLVRRMLLTADVLGLTLAFGAAQIAFSLGSGPFNRLDVWGELLVFLATLPVWIVVTKVYGLYDHDEERTDHTTVDDLVGVFHMVTVVTWLLFIGSWLTKVVNPDLPKLFAFWGLAITLVTLGRGAARAIARRQITYLQNTVIVGAGDVGQLIGRKLLNHPEYGINLVGFVDDQPKERREDLGNLTLLGRPDQLPAIVRLFDVERVIIAFTNDSHQPTIELIRSLKDLDIQIDIVPRLFELVSPGVGIHTVEGLPLVGLPPLRLSRSSRLLKRVMDLAIAVPALVLLAPFFTAIAILIKRGSSGPVFFRQTRMGSRETFQIYKFRTMTADADARKHDFVQLNKHAHDGGDPRMFKIPNDPRTTNIGRFLRRYSLDELPQLINVVKGDMTLVGPRPLILDEDQHVYEWARKRLDLKPGMTGIWQVLGRSEIPFDEMVKLDYLYVTGWSLWRDLRLLAQTLPAIAKAGDA